MQWQRGRKGGEQETHGEREEEARKGNRMSAVDKKKNNETGRADERTSNEAGLAPKLQRIEWTYLCPAEVILSRK